MTNAISKGCLRFWKSCKSCLTFNFIKFEKIVTVTFFYGYNAQKYQFNDAYKEGPENLKS